jgi:membrane fusion protein, multidrug efflux system
LLFIRLTSSYDAAHRFFRFRPVIAAILCSLMTAAACSRQQTPAVAERQETILPVSAIPAVTAGIRAVIHVSGVVVPAEGGEFLVVAPEPARIVEVTKAEGDPVVSGDVLVRFDLPSATQELARLGAELAGAQAQLENARINQSKIRDFAERGLVPRRDLEVADRELADAQSAVDRVRAAQSAAQTAAARAIVRAPFNGIVATRHHNPGDVVLSTSTDPVLRVVDPRRLDLIVSVPEADISRVVPGAPARIAAPAGGPPVQLTISGRAGERTGPDGTLPFRLLFKEPTQLPVDTRVEVDIDAEERTNTVLVPAEALVRDGDQTMVMIANGSKAERRAVTTGIQDEQRVEIISGVRAGELVITRGHIGLADGAAISVGTER